MAIIMDGNGRWAKSRGLPRVAGHRAGVEALRAVVRACPDLGIRYLSVYAFSTENWQRPRAEVDALWRLLVDYLRREVPELRAQGVRLQALGAVEELPVQARRQLEAAIAATAQGRRLQLNLAINYGGRREIVHAARRLAAEVTAGTLRPEDITESAVAGYLYTAGMPDPELVIRPSGEQRLSNFLLWQTAHARLWVTDVMWPDFRPEHLREALAAYGAGPGDPGTLEAGSE